MGFQKLAFSSSRRTLLLFVLFSVGLCYDRCDIGECSSIFQAAFSKLISSDIDSLCWDIKQVSKCLSECQQILFPHYLDKDTAVTFLKEICNEEFVYDVADHWECIRKNLQKFLLCITRSSSIKSSSSKSNDGKLISCRRRLLVFDCPEEVFLNHCEDEAVQIVSKKFKTALKPWLNRSCYGIPQNKLYSLDVYPGLKSEFDAIASCMDTNSNLAEDCFSEYLEKAVHSENHCWKDTMLVCNKPSLSVPCSPPSSVANFYPSLFSFGKLVCVESSTMSTTESSSDTYRSRLDEPKTIIQSMQPPSSTKDSTETHNFPKTKPFSVTDLKENYENTLPSNQQDGYFSPSDVNNSDFPLFGSSLNFSSSEETSKSSDEDSLGSQIVNEKSVSSHSHCTNLSSSLFLSYILVMFFPALKITIS